MRNLNYLLALAVAVFSFSCTSEDEKPKLAEKNITIEIEMEGNYTDYLVTFTVHSMLAGTSTFVTPVLEEPSNMNWTQVMQQANSYTLTLNPTSSTILVTSSAPIHSLGFVFKGSYLKSEPDESFSLPFTIRVLADGELYKEYKYKSSSDKLLSVTFVEEITFQ